MKLASHFNRWNTLPGNWDALNLSYIFPSSNEYGVPDLGPSQLIPSVLVPYGSTTVVNAAPPDAALHFFLDDYRFEPIWRKPQRMVKYLEHVDGCLSPDFSLYTDMPPAMQLWNVYRSRWIGALLAYCGVDVIPTVSWSDEPSFEFCFSGLPEGSVVAVSRLGVRGAFARAAFERGFREMVDRIRPSVVLCYGSLTGWDVPGDVDVRCYPTRWVLQQEAAG